MKEKKNQRGSIYSFYFDDRLKPELEQVAKEEDRSMSWIINKAISEYLQRRNDGKN